MAVGSDLLNVDDGSVGDAANLIETVAALALDLGGSLFLSAKQ